MTCFSILTVMGLKSTIERAVGLVSDIETINNVSVKFSSREFPEWCSIDSAIQRCKPNRVHSDYIAVLLITLDNPDKIWINESVQNVTVNGKEISIGELKKYLAKEYKVSFPEQLKQAA